MSEPAILSTTPGLVHVLCDIEGGLQAVEKRLGISLDPFWSRRLEAAIRVKESQKHIAYCRLRAVEEKRRLRESIANVEVRP